MGRYLTPDTALKDRRQKRHDIRKLFTLFHSYSKNIYLANEQLSYINIVPLHIICIHAIF